MPDGIRLAAHIQNAPDLWLLAAAFTGSLCLFLLELFAGKFLLPRFGGAPAVWVSCLAFFRSPWWQATFSPTASATASPSS